MNLNEMMGLRPFATFLRLFEGEGEGGAGGAGGEGTATAGDQKTDDAGAGDGTGDDVVLGGDDTGAGETSKDGETEDKDGKGDAKGEDEQKDPSPDDVVPEDGVYTVELPEGVELDQQLADAAFPVFKELGITQGAAQKLAEMFTTYRQADAQAVTDAWKNQQKTWVDSARADPEYATDGWDSAVKIADRALKKYGTPELAKALRETGMGNHPELIRAFYRMGKDVSDDTTGDTGDKRGSELPAEERLYGKTTPTTRKG